MAKYEFKTNDKKEFEYAFHGLDFLLCLWEMDQWLRSEVKYNVNNTSEEMTAFEKARDQLREIMLSHNVDLDIME